MRRFACLTAVGALTSVSCVDKGPGGSGQEVDPAYVEKHLLTEAPDQLDNQVNANLGEKVVYLGNTVETDTVEPGGTVELTHYWKVVSPPGDDWKVFAHAKGDTDQDWMNVDYTKMRAGYPPAKWKSGDIIRDEQEFALKEDWTSDHADILIGLYPKGRHDPSARMPVVSGPVDDENRVKAVRLTVGKPDQPTDGDYVVRKATGAIEIDGKPDEKAWNAAPWSDPFVDAEGGPSVQGETRAKLLYDDDNLYVFVNVEDQDVYSKHKKKDGKLWKADVVELFIDADQNRKGYVELQVNPNNAQLDSWFATTRAQNPKGDPGWDANMESAVNVHGTKDSRLDEDEGWDVEIAIPLEAVKGNHEAMKVNIPPNVGDEWNLNVVRADKPKDAQNPAAASWSQIPYENWHAIGNMLTVVFGDEKGNVEPAKKQTGAADGDDDGEADDDEADEAAKNEKAAAKPKPATLRKAPAKVKKVQVDKGTPKKKPAKAGDNDNADEPTGKGVKKVEKVEEEE